LALLALIAIGGVLLFSRDNRAQRELETTRRSLRQQGFKLELREFKLATSPEQSRRAALLGTTTRAALTNRSRSWPPWPLIREAPSLQTPVGTNAAIVVWKLEKLKHYRNPDLWPALRDTFTTNRARLDAAREAVLGGPIRFEPIGSSRPNALLPYLQDLRDLVTAFGMQTVLALHDGKKEAAWTNLLASTCLVTAYEPEPIDVSHMVRFACAALAYDTLWNALQAHEWTDAQLAELQRRWEEAGFWSGLPETTAYARANMAATCQLDRRRMFSLEITPKEALRAPKYAWSALASHWRRMPYWLEGSYEDERALLLYYRDRELELRGAVRSPTWSEMCQLPGVTNFVPFRAPRPSAIQAMMNQRQIMLAVQGNGQRLLGRAAETEARRRLIVTALALERYRGRHGLYPKTLEQLVPEVLKSLPTDFMDGHPLRYRAGDDGQFELYSVGLDCVDNGGRMRAARSTRLPYFEAPAAFGPQKGADLVWPRGASAAEVEELFEQERKSEEERLAAWDERQATDQWERAARRQARVESILAAPPPLNREPGYYGRPLSEVLANPSASGTNKSTMTNMLTLKQIVTGAEPETVTFELPLSYDVLKGLGALELNIDPVGYEDSDEGCGVQQLECKRATNGNCLLVWSTIYESPGKHALQAGLLLNKPAKGDEAICGPLSPFVVSNLCQFALSSASFTPEIGPTLRARLPESNGTYVIELKSPAGERLKTISGGTSNGVIEVHWDLRDDQGKPCTNNEFDTVFHLTLPGSGRAQSLRGP